MDDKETSNLNSVSIFTAVAIILCLVILSIGSSRFLVSKEKPVTTINTAQFQKAELVELTDNSSDLFGNYKGVLTILNPQIKFASSILIFSPNGRFTLQADSFSLATFKNDKLAINNEYPFLNLDIEGTFVAEAESIKLVLDKANFRFDYEEISLTETESSKMEEILVSLGINLANFKELPIEADLKINPNKDFLELQNNNSDFLFQVQVRKI